MRYLWQHIYTILDTYNNAAPLHYYLKQYYRENPKLGSRDRRGISDAVYAWYRCGKAFRNDDHNRETQVLAALLLCNLPAKALLRFFPPGWVSAWEQDTTERIRFLRSEGFIMDLELIFPADIAFSTGISKTEWVTSMLQQPDLFLRIRKDVTHITQLLESRQIPFRRVSDICLALPNGAPIDALLPAAAYVVQDASSQATGSYFHPQPGSSWWDCCSGAGGKSLLLKDLEPTVLLTASDVRASILHNLKERFRLYQLPQPKTPVINAADADAIKTSLGDALFDGILSDVPCTGAGTWARTPEQLYFFDPAQVAVYAARQEAILRNVADHVKPGGRIIYITCSVFRDENEAVAEKIAAEKSLDIQAMQLINGIAGKADCLFAAVLTKP